MTHTPTPWQQSHRKSGEEDGYSTQIYCRDGATIADIGWYPKPIDNGVISTYREANAARIVACVNACDGIDNAELNAGVIAELVEAARGLLLWHQTGGQSGDYTLHEKALSSALAKLGQTP